MGPRTKAPLRNYSRNTCGNRSKLDILHSILTDPIKKKPRRKPKLEIKQLPPRSQEVCAVNNSDSVLTADKLINDNTFDRLLNQTNYNKVTFKVIVQNNSSDSSLSTLQKSKQCSPLQLQITKKYSPVKKRRFRYVRKRSPIVTRSISLQNSLSNSNKIEDDKKVHTLDRTVDESLCIEKENVIKRFSADLSYATKENSFDPIFSKTFTEKYNNLNVAGIETSAISSTPVMPVFQLQLINETIISPIASLENEKLESNMTPKLKRVSKVRKSKLICDMGDSSCDTSVCPERSDSKQIALKDKSKLLRSAIVNVTLLNSTNLRIPFTNLTNIDLNSINETNLRNVISELNRSRIAVVNITTTNFDKYLNKSNIIDDDLDRVRSPIVNITRIDLNNILKQRSVCNESISDRSNELDVIESNSGSRINMDDSSNSGFKGFPAFNSFSQVKDEISSDFERTHLNLSENEDDLQIYLTLRRRKVPRSKCGDKSKQGGSINESANQTNSSARSASIIEDNLLIDKENASPKSYITLRTRRVNKSTPYRHSGNKSKSRIIKSQCNSLSFINKDMATQTDANFKFNIISPDLFGSDNSSNGITPKPTISPKESNVIDLDNDTIFSSEKNKRLRNSRFKQSVHPSKMGAIYYYDNTPIKVTKRNRMYTPKKNYKIVDSIRKTSTPRFITTPLKDTSNIVDDNTADSISASIRDATDFSENSPMKFTRKNNDKMIGFIRKTSTPKFFNRTTSLKDTSNIVTDKTADSISVSIRDATDFSDNTPIKFTRKNNDKMVDFIRKTSTPKFFNPTTPLKDTSNIVTDKTADSISASIRDATDFSDNTPIKFTRKNNDKTVDVIKKTSTPRFFNPTTSLKDTSSIRDNIIVIDKTVDSISASTINAADLSENTPIKLTERNKSYTPKKNENEIMEKSRKSQHICESPPLERNNETKEVVFAVPKLPVPKKRQDLVQEDKILLKPGKLWRRSLLEVRNSKSGISPVRQSLICVADKGSNSCNKENFIDDLNSKRLSVRVVPLSDVDSRQSTILEDYAVSCRNSYLQLQSSLDDTLCKDDSIIFIEQETQIAQSLTITAREIVLSKCGQEEPLSFAKLYPNSMLQNCQKIGEGVYGEVFLVKRPTNNDTSVMKIIPIEGNLIVNGERQKTFQEILSEITIAIELSKLRINTKNRTDCFNELKKVACVRGKYPKRLVELWELYDENRSSENDHPKMFNKDQLYIVLELANGGNDMENFVFENSRQAYSIITQITLALAVAESEIEFEHRDLHWGNVLISSTSDDNISFSLNGRDISLKSYGVHVAIIDYTLSRISHDNVCLYNDLAMDPDLFTATGDYQFEVYRLMQNKNNNDWQHFEPYTNVIWLHYLLDKCISSLRYRKKTTKLHKQYLGDLRKLYKDVLHNDSAEMFAVDKFVD